MLCVSGVAVYPAEKVYAIITAIPHFASRLTGRAGTVSIRSDIMGDKSPKNTQKQKKQQESKKTPKTK